MRRACGVAGAASSAGQSKARRRPRQRELLPRASGFLAAAPPPPCTMPMRRSRFARTGPSGNVWRSCSPISFNSIIRCHGGYWSGAAAGRRCARRICQLSVRQPASALATSFTARRPCNLICGAIPKIEPTGMAGCQSTWQELSAESSSDARRQTIRSAALFHNYDTILRPPWCPRLAVPCRSPNGGSFFEFPAALQNWLHDFSPRFVYRSCPARRSFHRTILERRLV